MDHKIQVKFDYGGIDIYLSRVMTVFVLKILLRRSLEDYSGRNAGVSVITRSTFSSWKYQHKMWMLDESFSVLREYDTVGIVNWFFHENSWFGQFRHALSKYAKKNIPSWLSFRDIYDRVSTIFRQIFKIRIFIAVKKISQFQNGKR